MVRYERREKIDKPQTGHTCAGMIRDVTKDSISTVMPFTCPPFSGSYFEQGSITLVGTNLTEVVNHS